MYIIILTILVLIFGFITYQLYMLYLHGGSMPDWTSNIVGGAFGSIVAILGSVFIQILFDYRKQKQASNVQLSLLKKEFLDNFMVCLFRIEKATDQIEFFTQVYDNSIINGNLLPKDKHFQEQLSDLYFLFKRGSYGKKTFSVFFQEVFSVQRKQPRHFQDVREIIESVGIEQIYEFSLLYNIIFLDYKYKFNLDLPIKDFQRVLDYDQQIHRDILEDTKNYITEIVCRNIFHGDKVIYFSDNLNLKGG